MNSKFWLWMAYALGFVFGIVKACQFVDYAMTGDYGRAVIVGAIGVGCLFIAVRASAALYPSVIAQI